MRVDYDLFARMIQMLKLASETFRYYEECHRAKGTNDGHEKAERNRKLAEQIEALTNEAEG